MNKVPYWVRVTLWGTLALTVAAIIIPAVLQAAGSTLRGDYKNPEQGRHSIPFCSTEDGREHRVCYWDARKQGNGEGRSFISYNFGSFVVFNDDFTVVKGE